MFAQVNGQKQAYGNGQRFYIVFLLRRERKKEKEYARARNVAARIGGPMQLDVKPFRADCTDKEQAVKVLEEASEAREAWQQLAGLKTIVPMLVPSKELDDLIDSHREILADEIADTITACANLAERYGLDLQAALGRVERKNRERGRYENGCG